MTKGPRAIPSSSGATPIQWTEPHSCHLRPDRRAHGVLFSKDYPAALRRVVVRTNRESASFLTNNFALKPELIADLYRQRWKVELFFKWIKQHLRIKAFLGTSERSEDA